jgi:hypothetical protein
MQLEVSTDLDRQSTRRRTDELRGQREAAIMHAVRFLPRARTGLDSVLFFYSSDGDGSGLLAISI